ncbi:MAG: FHA domain-containing protein [Verrucomicrobiia bacterium]
MALLFFEKANGERVEVAIAGDPLSIGRGPTADVSLDDLEISRHHCALLLWEDDWVLKDGGSINGTWVNQNRVPIAILKDGDIIRIGKTELEFRAEDRQRGKSLSATLQLIAPPTIPTTPHGKK